MVEISAELNSRRYRIQCTIPGYARCGMSHEIALRIVASSSGRRGKAMLACLLGQMIKSCESYQLGCLRTPHATSRYEDEDRQPLRLTIGLEVLLAY